MQDFIRAQLVAAGFEHAATKILSLARPAVRFHREKASDQSLPLGVSKIGGRPDFAPGLRWPMLSGYRFRFLAQINLSDLAPFSFCDVLPRRGLLQFFYDEEEGRWGYDPADRGTFCVRFQPSLNDLRRARGGPVYPAFRLHPREVMTLPAWELYEFEQLGLSEEERQAYFHARDELESSLKESEPLHQLLGQPEPIQGDMQTECQLVSHGIYCGAPPDHPDPRQEQLRPGAADWRLLLQVDSDEQAEMLWGDGGGRLYFWITTADLARRDFDKSWMILQTT